MAYFLGRDVTVGLTTEQPHYALELDGGDLKIAGHADNAYDANTVFVARRKDVGTASEETVVTFVSGTLADYASTASNNKYILLYNASGKKYLIWFDHDGNGVKPAGLDEDFNQEVDISSTTAHKNDIRGATGTAIANNTDFAAAFTITQTGATLTLVDKVTGSATDVARGSGYTNSHLTVAVNTQGAIAALADLPKVKLTDITGVDFTFGAMDEDIAYFGQRTALKAEIKNEITLSITKKKNNAGFSQLFNEARCGIRGTASGATEVAEGAAVGLTEMNQNLNQPLADATGTGFGYRLYLQLKAGTEVMTLRNMCITEYSVTLNADAVQEETIVFYGNVKPLIGTTLDDDVTSEADF
tara:strand:+ start:89 stop:1162 length:1074 start_codon:yes stop_codon:yes gene_type:complete